MKSLHFAAVLLLIGVGVAPVVRGQEDYDPQDLIDINVKGISVGLHAQYVEKQSENTQRSVNVIVSDEAANVAIGHLQLRGVTAIGAIKVLEYVSGDLEVSSPPIESRTPVVVVGVRGVDEPRQTISLSVADLLQLPGRSELINAGRYMPDDLLSAIQVGAEFRLKEAVRRRQRAASESNSRPQDPIIELHPETGLLLIAATPEEIAFFGEIIENLRASREELKETLALSKLVDRLVRRQHRLRFAELLDDLFRSVLLAFHRESSSPERALGLS